MRKVVVRLQSASPISFRRNYDREVPRKEKESHADYEERTWRNGLHVNDKDEVVIPACALKNCLADAAKYLGIQIPGKGKATYTKHFEAGVMVVDDICLGVQRNDVKGQWLFISADGKRGSGKRVWKCFGVIREWQADATCYILDDTITKDVFLQHLEQAGKFIGMGVYRPRMNGTQGRFGVVKVLEYSEVK